MSTNPSKILPSLKVAHATIITDIDRILECARNYKQARGLFDEFEQTMLQYVDVQRRSAYDSLIDQRQGSIQMLNFLHEDLLNLKIEFLEFVDRYPINANPVRVRNFPRDFQFLSKKILQRIVLEEDHFFPILARIDKNID